MSYEHLLDLEEMRRETFVPERYKKIVSVREFLDGVELDSERQGHGGVKLERDGIPPELNRRRHAVLPGSGFFDSDQDVQDLFVDAWLRTWKHTLRSARATGAGHRGRPPRADQ